MTDANWANALERIRKLSQAPDLCSPAPDRLLAIEAECDATLAHLRAPLGMGTREQIARIIAGDIFGGENVGPATKAARRDALARADTILLLSPPAAVTIARPISEYHEDMGPVLWWCWETQPPLLRERVGEKPDEDYGRWLGEQPYVGTPNDLGFEVLVETTLRTVSGHPDPIAPDDGNLRVHVGGWPGYHTHFTPLGPMPAAPTEGNKP